MRYKTIYADPPWDERGAGQVKRGADKHYSLMKTQEIIEMADFVKSISEDNSHLYLWATNNFLIDGLEIMKAWGFEYKTCITWIKDKVGLGQYFRGITEHCLFGVKGNLPYKLLYEKRQQGRTGFIELSQAIGVSGCEESKQWIDTVNIIIDGIVFTAPKKQHSMKPYQMRKMIEIVSYAPRIELFSREKFEGWDIWGKESIRGLDLYTDKSTKGE